jgi:hypothetical protein
MPVIFKSKATGDLLMVSAHAQALLDFLGKTATQPGILSVEDMPAALVTLHALPDEDPDQDEDRGDDEAQARRKGIDGVSARKRAWPLIRLIDEALAAGEPIVWGV